ncbi:T9SS type A sorting domain-containing protein [Polaribacter sp. IC073]|uniref:T9SS type A sorting domain-containing protein n=1 Tax=Polaribacter sp. IC073 TaxID=2508540 RepID=UPI0011BF195A|nr:T9SS type A sorting domain-containing protein [Polaribacter sp. IC073]TXD46551.1 T9SS type A sorting domain-containing protein [Polaribacter sp. IC073]
MKKTTFLIFTLLTISLFGQVKLTSSLSEYEDGGIWKKSYQKVYGYNNGYLSNQTYQNWNESNAAWTNVDDISYTYNSNNELTKSIEREWNVNTSSYVNGIKSEYTYNTNGNVSEFMDYKWTNNQWLVAAKFQINYNTNNKISDGIGYKWNGTAFVLEDRTILSYNGNNTIAHYVYEEWDGANWQKSDKTTFSYTASNKVSLELSKIWDGTMYVDDDKSEYVYDGNGNVINEKNSYIDNGVWVVGGNETVTYDTSKLMSSFIHPFADSTGLDYLFTGNPYINKILTSSYSNTDRTTYYYGNATASVNDFALADFAVYPNPTKGVLRIDDSNFTLINIEVFNIIGKKVFTSSTNELHLNKLVNGVYMLKIRDENGNFAIRKVLKN